MGYARGKDIIMASEFTFWGSKYGGDSGIGAFHLSEYQVWVIMLRGRPVVKMHDCNR